MAYQVLIGDCLQVLKTLETDSVDLIVTDPPYGISFMSKKWDEALPKPEVWKECLRVLKPGAFAFVMCIPRADCSWRLMAALEQAGFLIHFTPIYWAYASGFPKAQNIARAVSKREGAKREGAKREGAGTEGNTFPLQKSYQEYVLTENASTLDGSYGGFQPKPGVEMIVVAMKPMDMKTFVDQALKNGKGVTWLDDCRIPISDNNAKQIEQQIQGYNKSYGKHEKGISLQGSEDGYFHDEEKRKKYKQQGRFPANLLCSDDCLNDGEERQSGWENTDIPNQPLSPVNNFGAGEITGQHYSDSGSFSRYFDLDAWWQKKLESMPDAVKKTFPFLLVPKPSKAEKNKGCDDLPEKHRDMIQQLQVSRTIKPQHNPHPTVKPVKLMSYLIELGSRKGDLIVDPFAGSGTTGVAAVLLERNSTCIELNKEFAEIAKARISKVAEYVQKALF